MIRIDGYPIDAALEERISYEAEVTENAVEKGADITDHVSPRLPILEFDGVVSDTPIGAVATDPTRTGAAQQHSREAYKKFLEVFNGVDGKVVGVVVECSFGKFENMILKTLTPVKNAQSAKAFRFTASFKQIAIRENTRTTVRTSIRNGDKKQPNGLSIDNLVEGSKVLWRKGKPPGLSPATDPKGVIVGQEIVNIIKGKYYHQDRKTELTVPELEAFTKDLNRDSSLASRRQLAVIDTKLEKVEQRLKKAQKMLEFKDKHPGAQVDPAMFGL